jgi:hypothetical protein
MGAVQMQPAGLTEGDRTVTGANWLVCLAWWQGLSSRDTISKIAAVWFPVFAFTAIGFEHSGEWTVPAPCSALLFWVRSLHRAGRKEAPVTRPTLR